MQTPAEQYLIQQVSEKINVFVKQKERRPILLLNIGAGSSTVLETSISEQTQAEFFCDRVDIELCTAKNSHIRTCYQAPVEAMTLVESGTYDIAFSNYLLEHVDKLDEAVKEIGRVLTSGGIFIASVPNPTAPEFILSKHTPLWFHQLMKGKGDGSHAFETHYSFASINDLIERFTRAGFIHVETRHYAFTYGYLYRFPIIRSLSRLYDWIIQSFGIKRWMGNVGLVFKKQ